MKPKQKKKAMAKESKDSLVDTRKKAIAKDSKFISAQTILSLARKQLQEDEEKGAVGGTKLPAANTSEVTTSDDDFDEEDEIEYDAEEVMELDEEDAAAFNTFYPRDQLASDDEDSLTQTLSQGADIQLEVSDRKKMPPPRPKAASNVIASGAASGGATGTWISIGDLLRERVTDARSEIESQLSATSRASSVMTPEMKEIFNGMRQVLASYTHGQVPKLLKQLPHMPNCQEVVEELEPERWSSGAISIMTKFFVSKGGEVAAFFMTDVLLPRVRDHIAEHGKLNPTLIDALHRALFVTKIFFTSFLIPLIEDSHHPCTIAEATIICGLLKKARINPKYGVAALYLITKVPYTRAQILFVRMLLDKNYKIPDHILEEVHKFFMKFAVLSENEEDLYFNDNNRMPVSWFQALLIYVQKYKDFWSQSAEKCKELSRLCRVHKHPKITNAIRHELLTASKEDSSDIMESGD